MQPKHNFKPNKSMPNSEILEQIKKGIADSVVAIPKHVVESTSKKRPSSKPKHFLKKYGHLAKDKDKDVKNENVDIIIIEKTEETPTFVVNSEIISPEKKSPRPKKSVERSSSLRMKKE